VRLGPDLPVSQPLDPDLRRSRIPLQVGEQVPQRMDAADVISPIGENEEQPARPEGASEVPEDVEGSWVCPVQILDGDDGRPIRREAADQRRNDVVEPIERGSGGDVRVSDRIQ
jgi:hypothetical protein